MRRKQLTSLQENDVIRQRAYCFICEKPISGVAREELIFDHIKSLEGGGTNEISNYAAVHKDCHKGKGTKSLEDYKEELRLNKEFAEVASYVQVQGRLNPTGQKPSVEIDYARREVKFGESRLPLYQCPNTGIWYFYHAVDRKLLSSDVEVQPRGLEQKRLRNLAMNLRRNFQLSPTVCRLLTAKNELLIFDGQHKATAQAVGNNNERVDCKILIDPPLDMVRRVVIEGHGALRQQEFKTSELFRKLDSDYRDLLQQWQEAHPGEPLTEKSLPQALNITKDEANAKIFASIVQSIIEDDECEAEDFVSRERRPGEKPLSYEMFAGFVKQLAKKPPAEEPMEAEDNFREEERQNIIRLINVIVRESLKGKWTPTNAEAASHKKAKRLYYRNSFREWTKLLSEALHWTTFVPSEDPIFYRNINPDEWSRIERACRRLFTHPMWMNPDPDIEPKVSSNTQRYVHELFSEVGLNLEYLCKP